MLIVPLYAVIPTNAGRAAAAETPIAAEIASEADPAIAGLATSTFSCCFGGLIF
jgi:hypothetical protein